jgi:hypothetical protein
MSTERESGGKFAAIDFFDKIALKTLRLASVLSPDNSL